MFNPKRVQELIPGFIATENEIKDMDEDYTDYLFHAKGALKGIGIGVVVAILAAILIALF